MLKQAILKQVLKQIVALLLVSVLWSSLATAQTESDHGEWRQYGYDYREQRFSPLQQINQTSVSELGLSWHFDTDFNRGLEATPIVIDGVMYVTGNWSMVYALNARTGKLLWRYDPQVPREWGMYACCDVVNRGVAVADGKVVFGTLDARLIALDASTGKPIWEIQSADTKLWPYTITGAPRIAKGKVFIGNGGAEYGVRGFVSAFDLQTGELVWRFYTVPGNPADGFENEQMRLAADTWTGQWWKRGGGGTVWDSIVYDEALDQLYIGVGNGTPWNRKVRSPDGGDNLYLSSIVALNPDTGDYIWHYQETPAESWDYTASQHIMLADMQWQGQAKKVIWHAPKNGFFFVIDRSNGKLLSAEPFANVNWADGYDLETGRPIESSVADYSAESQFIRPSQLGAHNWQPMAHSPETGLVYIPTLDTIIEYKNAPQPIKHEAGFWNTEVEQQQQVASDSSILHNLLISKLTKGSLLAWDPQRQEAAWNLELPLSWNGGLLATAGGLVFQGTSAGELLAVNASDGDILWRYPTQVGIIAPPITYAIDGEQYLAVLAGWGGAFGLVGGLARHYPVPPSRVLVFKLGANQQLPPKAPQPELPPIPERLEVSSEVIEQGRYLYDNYCYQCHGGGLNANHAVPDLRRLPMAFYDNYDAIVRDGLMKKAGMVSFSDVLSKEETDAIYAYIIDSAHILREEQNDPQWYQSLRLWFYRQLANVADLLTSLL